MTSDEYPNAPKSEPTENNSDNGPIASVKVDKYAGQRPNERVTDVNKRTDSEGMYLEE